MPPGARAAAERGRLRGIGIACFLETSRGTPGERAEIRFEADGRVALVLGTQSNGQGHETSFAQIAADLLGLPVEAFRFVQADTEAVKSGNGHGGARSMHIGGTALYLAAQMVLSKARVIAAHLLQADVSDVSFSAGRFTVGGSERGIGVLELAEAARDPANLPDGMTPGLNADAYNDSDVFTFPNGCHAAEVEIDPETGTVTLVHYAAVDDYGRVINPMLTLGQVQGGLAQGIGQALFEHTVYEEGSGQLLSGSFMDYALPRADDPAAPAKNDAGISTSPPPNSNDNPPPHQHPACVRIAELRLSLEAPSLGDQIRPPSGKSRVLLAGSALLLAAVIALGLAGAAVVKIVRVKNPQ